MKLQPVIVVLGPSALPVADKLRGMLFAEVHGPQGMQGVTRHFDRATRHMADLFHAGRPIIGICATGILVRALGPLAKDKQTEPPVVAVSEDGHFAIPLLGGHHGANELARKISKLTNGHAAISTASDALFGTSLDDVPMGYVLATPNRIKTATSRLLTGERLRMRTGTAPWLAGLVAGEGTVPVDVSIHPPADDAVTYHPRVLTVGVGCERGTSREELRKLIDDTFARHNLVQEAVACFASIDLKEDEDAIMALGNVRYFSTAELNAQSARIKRPSEVVRAEVGTPSVAEAAALAAAGTNAKLLVSKHKSKRATIAVAQATAPVLKPAGRPAGRISVVGLGPGHPLLRSPEATTALAEASDWVGYSLYLDLAVDQHRDQTRHDFPLGEEEDRCRHAINLAKQGKRVALVCSGDAAIYAMAALVYELIDREPCRVAVDVHPGISAFQIASARTGAIIGHDFCCISLSDLLTPWETIENRLKAAAAGDFVVALYNPRSLKRIDKISQAFDILKPHRKPDTPVVVASNLGRPEENVQVLPFDQFKPDLVDMLTIVLVGSTQSRAITRGDGRTYAYTPRGYASKMGPP